MSRIRQLLRLVLNENETFSTGNAEHLARTMLAESRTDNDRQRREWARRVVDAYFADNLQDFEAYLKRFAFKKPEDKAHVKSAMVRQYAYTKATVFNTQPVLEVHVGGEKDEDQTDLLNEIYTTGRWFEALQQGARFEKVVNTVHLVQRPSEGTIWLDAVTPDEAVVFQRPGAPNMPLALMYKLTSLQLFDSPHEEAVAPQLWAFWSNEAHFLFVTDDAVLDLTDIQAPPENPDKVNPYGRIPATKVQNERPGNGQYWGPLALDVWLAEMSVSAGFMAVLEGIISQGFTITHSSGFPQSLFTDGRGVGSHFNVEKTRQGENAPTFGSVKLDTQIAQMVEGADAIAQHIALMRGLPPQALSIKQAAESGFSKLVDLAPQMEEREGDIERWTVYLKDAFDLLKVTWEHAQGMAGFEPISTEGFSEDAELFVSFPEPKVFETPKERLERLDLQLSLGLTGPVDALMELDPDMNQEQAEKKLAEINEQGRVSNAARSGILGNLRQEAEAVGAEDLAPNPGELDGDDESAA
ncbi:MAG: hypothetical protein ACYTFZ_03995 [Planctomycetota bacterium]|jgi:hypothetical protein